ncbi:tripartite tricarboxylate transporter TctB family protein [Azospirillum brasilense]|uniref:Tripartite tricarboxylate transporter TctB family protein n=1 Tax=Azospirillum brasilense TaxID=192 RepID=A0A6L3B4Q7_AZOBR|nr:tripartite tricarboxylate transporter TctB family protein [Azospirillum brasilense]KAA0687557.1 tripartite tricarboxylate transporter TctB family protein [Azospirillum brasilense]
MSNAPAPGGKVGLRPQDRLATLVIAALVMAVAVAAIIVAGDFPPTMLETDVGPARFPIIFAVALLVLCAILVFNTLRAPAAPPDDPAEVGPKISYGTVAIGIALTALCLFAMEHVGYMVATVPYLFALMWLMGRRNLIMNAVLAVGLTILIDVAFVYALNVPLPTGSLFE